MSEAHEADARVRADIAQHGWHEALFPPEGDTPGWGHTIGLVERFDSAELVVFGRDLQIVRALLHGLALQVRGGARLAADQSVAGVIADAPLALRSVARKWIQVFLGNAAWHYQRDDFAALQAYWPDPHGCFPWQPECDARWRADQPLLHLPETQRALSEPLIAVLRREGAL